MSKLTSYKSYIFFLLVIGIGLMLLLLFSKGYYPLAMVNGHIITAKEFSENYGAATLYYQNTIKTYKPLFEGKTKLTDLELQASVLDQLIENSLIHEEAKKELGKDFEGLLKEKVDKYNDNTALSNAVQALYGMSPAQFRENILVPQAERDLLTGRLFLQGGKIDDWLIEARAGSKVQIFSNKLYWDGKGIKVHE